MFSSPVAIDIPRSCVMRVCNRLGIRSSSVSKQSKHLDYTHPSMEAVRSFIGMSSEREGIEPRLVANFDQVWSMHYEGPRSVMYKHSSKRSQLFDTASSKPSLQRMTASIRRASNLHSAEDQQVVPKEVCKPVTLNAAGNLNVVDYARNARTLTTLSWADGDLGRGFITIQPGAMFNAQLSVLCRGGRGKCDLCAMCV